MHPASWRWQIRTWTLDYRCSATVENISNQRGKADHVINYAQVRQNPTHGQQCREFVVVTTMAATPCTNPWMVFSKLHRGWSCCFEINFEFREVAVPHFCCVCQVNIFFCKLQCEICLGRPRIIQHWTFWKGTQWFCGTTILKHVQQVRQYNSNPGWATRGLFHWGIFMLNVGLWVFGWNHHN